MRKVLQNSLFAAMTAWGLYGLHAQLDNAADSHGPFTVQVAWQR